MTEVIAIMSMSVAGFVADGDDGVAEVFEFDQLASAPVVLGNPTVVHGVGITHLRYPLHTA